MHHERRYEFGDSSLTLCFGDLTKSDAQVVVSSDDCYLTMGGGVSAAILNAGGHAIALDASKKVPAQLGDVVVTNAGTLPAHYVFHAVTIGRNRDAPDHRAVVRNTTQRCLQLLDALNLETIAFPAIGAGVAGFPYEDVAVEMADVVSSDLLHRQRPIRVTIYLFDRFRQMQPVDFLRFFEEFAARVPRLRALPGGLIARSAERGDKSADREPASEADVKSRRINNLRRLLAALEDQRFKLEQQLIEGIGADDSLDSKAEVREHLKQNEELRLGYRAELQSLSAAADGASSLGAVHKPRTVFVSSTFRDLEQHRVAIKDQIARRDLLFRGMEHFGADPNNQSPSARIIEGVRNADLYLGVFGVRYGSVDAATGLSMTELEFKEAEAMGKPMLLYVIHETAPVQVCDIEPTSSGKAKLDALKARILQCYTPYLFRTVEDLARQVYEDLGKPLSAPRVAPQAR